MYAVLYMIQSSTYIFSSEFATGYNRKLDNVGSHILWGMVYQPKQVTIDHVMYLLYNEQNYGKPLRNNRYYMKNVSESTFLPYMGERHRKPVPKAPSTTSSSDEESDRGVIERNRAEQLVDFCRQSLRTSVHPQHFDANTTLTQHQSM